MAICKDCFHWDVCKAMLEVAGGIRIADDFKGSADRCKEFVSAADVAPRAEVEAEIFNEITKMFFEKQRQYENSRQSGKARQMMIARFEVYKLQKKYTEAETEPPKTD